MAMAKDWRGDSHYIGDLVAKLIQPENLGKTDTDIFTFLTVLPNPIS